MVLQQPLHTRNSREVERRNLREQCLTFRLVQLLPEPQHVRLSMLLEKGFCLFVCHLHQT